jgi:hypothetical protein
VLTVSRRDGLWTIASPREKLAARGRLPGAFGYDLAARSFRAARESGVAIATLVPAAMPCSWMVNARAPSPQFHKWLKPPLRDVWNALATRLASIEGDVLDALPSARDEIEQCVATLSTSEHSVAAISKVLALLCPSVVPLMDDAAIWFALGALESPSTADAPRAQSEWFVPMLDWLARGAARANDELAALARDYAFAPLDAAQVLDRLLWFESWGFRVAPSPQGSRWQWVRDEGREAIVVVVGTAPDDVPRTCVDLANVADGAWKNAAREALAAGLSG